MKKTETLSIFVQKSQAVFFLHVFKTTYFKRCRTNIINSLGILKSNTKNVETQCPSSIFSKDLFFIYGCMSVSV